MQLAMQLHPPPATCVLSETPIGHGLPYIHSCSTPHFSSNLAPCHMAAADRARELRCWLAATRFAVEAGADVNGCWEGMHPIQSMRHALTLARWAAYRAGDRAVLCLRSVPATCQW